MTMASIPLSARDIDPPEGTSNYNYATTAPEEVPGSFSEKGFESAFEKAYSQVEPQETEPVNDKKGLDHHLNANLEKHYAAVEDKESFQQAREPMDALQSRYAAQGGSLKHTLQAVLHMGQMYRADPAEATAQFIRSYSGMSPWLGKSDDKPAPETFIDGFGNRHSGKFLSHVIDQASDRATSDREDYETTAAERKELCQLLGVKTFSEAIRIVADLDREAISNPEGVGLRLNQMFGGPQTPEEVYAQREAKAEQQLANAEVAAASQRLPGFDALKGRMAQIVQSDPRFDEALRAGVPQQDVLNVAYQIAAGEYQQAAQEVRWTNDQLQLIAQKSEPLARAIVDVLDPKHPSFVEGIWRISDPEARLQAAAGVALRQVQDNDRAIAKAKRARPVKSSSGAIPGGSGKGSGLDAHLSAAINKHF
jgi:hypothetical protein